MARAGRRLRLPGRVFSGICFFFSLGGVFSGGVVVVSVDSSLLAESWQPPKHEGRNNISDDVFKSQRST